MGRKSKLKHDKRRAASTAAKMNNNNNQETLATESATGAEAITTVNADIDADADADADAATTAFTEKDKEFPKSDHYVQAMAIKEENWDQEEFFNLCMRGAKEHGCVHSMFMVARFIKQPHLRQPWLLEASILGSRACNKILLLEIYANAEEYPPRALVMYWMKMSAKHGNMTVKDTAKECKDIINKSCCICQKVDTETLTLRQCIGCSTYCYCDAACQTIHWEVRNHRNECKQFKILNKYHKPYAKEIRKAAIRGDTHPALEKLRSKLGLSRPIEDYQDLMLVHPTHEGKPIDPYEYVIAREDGTMWSGSTPTPIGPFSDTDTFTSTSPATPTTLIHDGVPLLYGIGGNTRPSIQPGRNAIIHNLQSKSSLHLNSTNCIIQKILRNGRVAVEVSSNNNNVMEKNNSKLKKDSKIIALLPTKLEMVLEIKEGTKGS